MKPYPPLGLLSLSAFLKRAGFSVEVFDSTFGERGRAEARLRAAPGGVVGIYTNLMTRRTVLDIIAGREAAWLDGGARRARERQLHRRIPRRRRRRHRHRRGRSRRSADCCPRLPTAGPHRLHGVRGIAFRDETGTVVRTADAPEASPDLDALPFPDREAIDHRPYLDVWKTHHGASSINLITARGCPYRCNWCSHAVYGYSHRRRSPANVADEMAVDRRSLRSRPGLVCRRRLHHQPPVAARPTPPSSSARGIHRPFETITRADRLQNEDAVRAAAASSAAIASGSARRAAASASSTPCSAASASSRCAARAALAQAHGIQVGMFLMWGYEGEEIEDIAATVEHVKLTQSRRLLHHRVVSDQGHGLLRQGARQGRRCRIAWRTHPTATT